MTNSLENYSRNQLTYTNTTNGGRGVVQNAVFHYECNKCSPQSRNDYIAFTYTNQINNAIFTFLVSCRLHANQIGGNLFFSLFVKCLNKHYLIFAHYIQYFFFFLSVLPIRALQFTATTIYHFHRASPRDDDIDNWSHQFS